MNVITKNPLSIWIGRQIERTFIGYWLVTKLYNAYQRITRPVLVVRFRRQMHSLNKFSINTVLDAHQR